MFNSLVTHIYLKYYKKMSIQKSQFSPFSFYETIEFKVSHGESICDLILFSRAHHYYFYPSCLDIYNAIIRVLISLLDTFVSQEKGADAGQRGASCHSPPWLVLLYHSLHHKNEELLKSQTSIYITLGQLFSFFSVCSFMISI